MQNDLQLHRDLCKYQSNEINTLKRKLQACKCFGVKAEPSGEIEEVQKLRVQNQMLTTNVEELKREITELKKASTSQQNDSEIDVLRKRLSSTREKYKKLKTIHEETNLSLEAMRVERDGAVAAKEGALKNPQYHARQRWQGFVEKSIEPIDEQYLQLPLQTLPRSGNSRFSMAMDAAVNASKAIDGIVVLRHSEVLFPNRGINHLVTIVPAHRFSSKADGGVSKWEKSIHPLSAGQTRDVFFHTKDAGFQYLGTYKCVVTQELAMCDVKSITGFNAGLHDGCIVTKTVPSMPKPPAGLTKAVQALYKDGVLQVVCLGLQCVGFDQDVKTALFSIPYKDPKVASVPGQSKKRKRDGSAAGLGSSVKRSKKNSK